MRNADVGRAALAEAAGVYPTTISKWLSDKNVPDPEPLDRAARKLGVTSHWLRHGNGPAVVSAAPPDLEVSARTVRERAAEYAAILHRVPVSMGLPEELPTAVRAAIREFETELTTDGASEFEIEFVRRMLTAPEHIAFLSAGDADREARMLKGMKAMMEGLRVWFREQHAP